MPDDLTDNEKAATFIGWEPICTKCGYCDLKGRPHKDRPGFTHFCAEHGKQVGHANDAPDMHRPDNYMQALEAVAERDLFVTISIYKASGGPHYTRVTIQRGQLPDEAEEPLPLGQGQSPEAGRSAITALAALYDKEHQNV